MKHSLSSTPINSRLTTVDTVKEAPAKEKSSDKEEKTEKKGLFGKKKKDEEDK